MLGRERQPVGRARADYSSPCPGCGQRILAGAQVTRVDLPGRRPSWWHLACRRAAVRAVVDES